MLTNLALLLLCAAAISGGAVAADDAMASYRVLAFNDTTTGVDILAATNWSVSNFDPRDHGALLQDRSEGFLLLAHPVDIWRAAGAGGRRSMEASFNTSFTMSAGANKAISFLVLLDHIPLFTNLRGNGTNHTAFAFAAAPLDATTGAAVQVGPVMSYADSNRPDVGVNVTVVAPRGSPALAVWIEYDASAHRLSVYVSAAGQPKPARALVAAPLYFYHEQRTTETALVGFFAGSIRDVVLSVRNWSLTVDRFPAKGGGAGDGNKMTSWLGLMLAVMGSSVVCCL